MNTDLPNNVVGFSRTACRIGELLAASAGVDPEGPIRYLTRWTTAPAT